MRLTLRKQEAPVEEPTLARRDWQLLVELLREACGEGRHDTEHVQAVLAVIEPKLEQPDVEDMQTRYRRLAAENPAPSQIGGFPESYFAATHRDTPRTTVGW